MASNTHTDAIYIVSLIMITGEPLTCDRTETAERQRVVFEICLPKKVQNFTEKFNGKELKCNNKYEIITSDDGWAYTMIIKGVLSSDFKELSVETADLVQKTSLITSNAK